MADSAKAVARARQVLVVSLAVTCFSCNESRAREATRGERPVTVATPAGERASEPRPAEGAATVSWAASQTLEKAEPAAVSAPPATLAKGKFNSAQACGSCHQAIFAKWSHSMHSNSYVDPVFRDALYKAHYLSQGKAAPACLRCHSPTVGETKDYYGTAQITREGVTCDFCHSIGAISTDASGTTRYQLDWTRKHGPYPTTESPAHEVGYREFFEKSEICAGCHDMSTPDGTMVFSTYSEWKASKYAEEGRQCHDCHMPRLAGRTVREGLKVKGHDIINDHQLLGGHEPTQVKRAVTVRIESLSREAERVRAVVAVENSGAGHYVPTGIPSRKLVLSLSATQRRRVIFQRNLVYQRVMQDENDRTLTEDWEIKLLSKRCLRDNRLAPLEVRRETFVFNAAPDDDVDVSVRLDYVHGRGTSVTQGVEIRIAEVDQILQRGLREVMMKAGSGQ
jgi:hypothetical protein